MISDVDRIAHDGLSVASAGGTRDRGWAWSPRDGRWRPHHGYPASAALINMSTQDFRDVNAYDAWRHHAYYTFDADPLPCEEARRFGAAVVGAVDADGEFYRYRSHAIRGRGLPGAADRDGGDPLSLGFVVKGERRVREALDDARVSRSGDFFVYDPRDRVELSWTQHEAMHVVLRRPAVERALGTSQPSCTAILRALSTSKIVPLVRNQFAGLARNIAQLDPQELSFMLRQTIDLALFACSQARVAEHDGLFVAAIRLIERRLDDPALSPGAMAATLGVSRATLYRAFAVHELAVAEVIREARLVRARHLIASGTSIAGSALASGWPDAGNFARAFKARFGLRPSEIRETE